MSDEKVYPVPEAVTSHALLNDAQYKEMYQRSMDDPDGFWGEQADKFVTWFKGWDEDKVAKWDFFDGKIAGFIDNQVKNLFVKLTVFFMFGKFFGIHLLVQHKVNIPPIC